MDFLIDHSAHDQNENDNNRCRLSCCGDTRRNADKCEKRCHNGKSRIFETCPDMFPTLPLVGLPLALRVSAQDKNNQHQSRGNQKTRNYTGFKQGFDGCSAGYAVYHIQQSGRDQWANNGDRGDETGGKSIFIPVLTHFRINSRAKQCRFCIGHAQNTAKHQSNDGADIGDAAPNAPNDRAAEIHQAINISRQPHQLASQNKHRNCHQTIIVGGGKQLLCHCGKIGRSHGNQSSSTYQPQDISDWYA